MTLWIASSRLVAPELMWPLLQQFVHRLGHAQPGPHATGEISPVAHVGAVAVPLGEPLFEALVLRVVLRGVGGPFPHNLRSIDQRVVQAHK